MEMQLPDMSNKLPKEMLSCTPANVSASGKIEWRINNSSVDLISTCPRKAYYALKRGLVANEEKPALVFGTAIHKALEVWYTMKPAVRTDEPALEAFFKSGASLETLVEGTDKRSLSNGEKILRAYFACYRHDPFEIMCDAEGLPYTERRLEFKLAESDSEIVYFFGTVDAILHDTTTNTIVVCDHKTTHALGKEFLQRVKPNHQYTGYVLGARRALGLDTNLFLVNGLQVAKTKCEFSRQITTRDEADFLDFTNAVMWALSCYKSFDESGVWPQTAPNPCSMYGGCTYHDVCAAPVSVRETMLSGLFKQKEASE